MTRIPRTHIEGAVYYVTSRGDNNENIFKDESDYRAYLDLLKKYKEQYGFKLFAFVLMPNHLHLLMELKEGLTISDIMHDLNANYTKYFNSRYQRKGHLFQERYKMVVAEKASYLLYISAYIHLNPKVLNLVVEPKDYGYSSCGVYLKTEELKNQKTNALDLTEEIKEAAALLGATVFSSYEDFLKRVSAQEMELLGKDLTKKTILGSEGFLERIKSEVESYKLQVEKEGQPKARLNRKLILTGVAAILILGCLSLYLYKNTLMVKENVKEELVNKEKELEVKIGQEKEKVIRGMDEKYRADRISYKVMQKNLEMEKKKAEELEKRLEGGKK